MARKPSLSPSKITTYLACPVKYKWTYLDPRGKWYLRAHHYYSFGSSLHKVLQRFHDANDSGVETVEQAAAALEESWIQAGYKSPQEMEESLGLGKEIITQYVTEFVESKPNARVLFVEKQLRMDLGEFVLIGILDRVDEDEAEALEVIDYKSGRQEVTPQDVEFSLAMSAYQLLLKHHYPDRRVSATLLAVRTGARASHEMSTEALDQFKQDLIAIGNEILNVEHEQAVPRFKPLCYRCDFVELCRKHPEFELPSDFDRRVQELQGS